MAERETDETKAAIMKPGHVVVNAIEDKADPPGLGERSTRVGFDVTSVLVK